MCYRSVWYVPVEFCIEVMKKAELILLSLQVKQILFGNLSYYNFLITFSLKSCGAFLFSFKSIIFLHHRLVKCDNINISDVILEDYPARSLQQVTGLSHLPTDSSLLSNTKMMRLQQKMTNYPKTRRKARMQKTELLNLC